MAKQAAAKHVFSVSAPVNAAPAHVFDALSCASNFEALFSAVQDLSPQASGGFGGRASALFLREDVTLKVVLTQAPERFVIHLTDEYSLVVYDFSIAAAGAGSNVACCVECCTCSGEGDAWPSERLARMVERQDGLIAQRLKGSVERAAAAETCTVSVC